MILKEINHRYHILFLFGQVFERLKQIIHHLDV
jgi:hypothetical protein